ncbi:hypothetical protein RI367_006836 [Sorochytrium milnesiophthora]
MAFRRQLQQLRGLAFELIFALVTENDVSSFLNQLGTAIEWMQMLAFIYSTKTAAWNVPALQSVASGLLLSLPTRNLVFFYSAVVLLQNLIMLYLLHQVSRTGGVSNRRALQVQRVLMGITGRALFFPILQSGISVCWRYFYLYATDFGLVEVMFVMLVTVLGLVIPTISLALFTETKTSVHRMGFLDRASPRFEVTFLVLKTVIVLLYVATPSLIFSLALLAVLAILSVASAFIPQFFFPVSNLVGTAVVSGLAFCSAMGVLCNVLAVLEGASPLSDTIVPPSSGSPHLFAVSILGALPVACLSGRLFARRYKSLAPEFNVIEYQWAELSRAIPMLFGRPAHGNNPFRTEIVSATQSCSAASIARTTHNAFDVQAITFGLFTSAGVLANHLIFDYLVRCMRKFPDNTLLPRTYVALAASMGNATQHSKLQIQHKIQKLLHANRVPIDVRFTFYRVLKSWELEACQRQTPVLHHAPILDVINYHYNYTQALRHHGVVLRASLNFWQTVSSGHVPGDMDTLQKCRHQSEALRHYHILLTAFPTATSAMRMYASFVNDCISTPKIARDIAAFADRLDGKHKREMSGMHGRTDSESTLTDSADDVSDALSLFDIEMLEDRRGGMVSVVRLRRLLYAALFIPLLGVVALYWCGMAYLRKEPGYRAQLYRVSEMRTTCGAAAYGVYTLQQQFNQGAPTAQVQSSFSTLAQLGQTLGDQLNDCLHSANILGSSNAFWLTSTWNVTFVNASAKTTPVVEPPLSVLRALIDALSVMQSKSAASTTSTDLDVMWLTANVLQPSLHDYVDSAAHFYLTAYRQENERQQFIMQCIVAGFAVSVAVLLLFGCLPAWRRVSQELRQIGKLFSQVPKQAALALVADMQRRIQHKEEQQVLERPSPQPGDDPEGDQMPVRGKTSRRLSLGHEEDDCVAATHYLRHYQDRPGQCVLVTFLVSLLVISSGTFAMYYILKVPHTLMPWRANAVYYAGARTPLVSRTALYLGEMRAASPLVFAAPTDAQQALSVASALLDQYHQGVLYGDARLNLSRTIGINTAIDALTLSASCASYNASCISLDQAVQRILSLSHRAASVNATSLQGQTVLQQVQSDINYYATPNGDFMGKLSALNSLYETLSDDTTSMCVWMAKGLFGLCVPLYAVVWYLQWRSLKEVAAGVRCLRGILLQLPEDTINSVDAIQRYLATGVIARGQTHSPASALKQLRRPLPAASSSASTTLAPSVNDSLAEEDTSSSQSTLAKSVEVVDRREWYFTSKPRRKSVTFIPVPRHPARRSGNSQSATFLTSDADYASRLPPSLRAQESTEEVLSGVPTREMSSDASDVYTTDPNNPSP